MYLPASNQVAAVAGPGDIARPRKVAGSDEVEPPTLSLGTCAPTAPIARAWCPQRIRIPFLLERACPSPQTSGLLYHRVRRHMRRTDLPPASTQRSTDSAQIAKALHHRDRYRSCPGASSDTDRRRLAATSRIFFTVERPAASGSFTSGPVTAAHVSPIATRPWGR
jgi:hypothetical protein